MLKLLLKKYKNYLIIWSLIYVLIIILLIGRINDSKNSDKRDIPLVVSPQANNNNFYEDKNRIEYREEQKQARERLQNSDSKKPSQTQPSHTSNINNENSDNQSTQTKEIKNSNGVITSIQTLDKIKFQNNPNDQEALLQEKFISGDKVTEIKNYTKGLLTEVLKDPNNENQFLTKENIEYNDSNEITTKKIHTYTNNNYILKSETKYDAGQIKQKIIYSTDTNENTKILEPVLGTNEYSIIICDKNNTNRLIKKIEFISKNIFAKTITIKTITYSSDVSNKIESDKQETISQQDWDKLKE